jgi:hypothetical protein
MTVNLANDPAKWSYAPNCDPHVPESAFVRSMKSQRRLPGRLIVRGPEATRSNIRAPDDIRLDRRMLVSQRRFDANSPWLIAPATGNRTPIKCSPVDGKIDDADPSNTRGGPCPAGQQRFSWQWTFAVARRPDISAFLCQRPALGERWPAFKCSISEEKAHPARLFGDDPGSVRHRRRA